MVSSMDGVTPQIVRFIGSFAASLFVTKKPSFQRSNRPVVLYRKIKLTTTAISM
jgi:hypothetical protein